MELIILEWLFVDYITMGKSKKTTLPGMLNYSRALSPVLNAVAMRSWNRENTGGRIRPNQFEFNNTEEIAKHRY